MTSDSRTFSLFLVLVVFALLPFFEGGETSTGLFLIHTLVLVAFVIVSLSLSRFWIPRFLIYFAPFLLALLISTILVAPYKYAAFLELWDFVIGGLFAVTLFTTFKESEDRAQRFPLYAFLAAGTGTLVSAVLGTPFLSRVRGYFVNPNEFASFSLLLIIVGLFQYERESNRKLRSVIAVYLLLLSVSVALAASRATFLAAGVFLITYLWRRRPNRLVAASMILAFALFAVVLGGRFHFSDDPLRYYRLKIWKHSLEGILRDPYLGVGLNMLPYNAARFNFPADVEIGRYARIAKSADSQYLQILAETGFLGFFTFLIGWAGLYFALSKLHGGFAAFRFAFYALSMIAFFSLPLQNTAVFLLFLFIITFPLSFNAGERPVVVSLGSLGRIALPVIVFLLLTFGVFLPYIADREMAATRISFGTDLRSASDPRSANEHLHRALRYNPFQPYYRFAFIRGVVDANPRLQPAQWLLLTESLNESIRLNPLEPDFYAYKAKIYAVLLDLTHRGTFYSQAVSAYQAALDQSPYNVFLRGEFVYFLRRLGRVDMAEAELQKILEAEPAYLNARLLLAEVKLGNKDSAGAKSELQEVEKFDQRYQSLLPSMTDAYARRLLKIDQEEKEKVKRLILESEQAPAK